MNMGRRKFLLGAGLVAAAETARKANAQGITFQKANLTITSQTGIHKFTVDIATNTSQVRLGLRHRREIPPDAGLLILQSARAPGRISVSTEGVALPLDLLFITHDGTITEVSPWIPTNSATPIVSTGPVSAALQLAGGTTVRYRILRVTRLSVAAWAGDRLSNLSTMQLTRSVVGTSYTSNRMRSL